MIVNLIKTEFFKIRKSPILILLILLDIIVFIYMVIFKEYTIERAGLYATFFDVDYSKAIIILYIQKTTLLSMPVIVVLAYWRVSMELKNGRYNSTFTMPCKKSSIYISRIAVLIAYITIHVVVLGVMTTLNTVVFTDKLTIPISTIMYVWIVSVMFIIFQYFAALLTRNLVLYILLFMGQLVALVVIRNDYRMLIPKYYDNPFTAVKFESMPDIGWYIIAIYIALFSVLGFLLFKKLRYGRQKSQ